MSLKYMAWAYKDSKPWKMIYVYANSKEEAINLAYMEFAKLGIYTNRVEVS